MAKIPLTPEQKAEKLLRDQLKIAHNRVMGAWSFHEITTWEGVFNKLGYSPEYISKHPEYSTKKGILTFPELKEFLAKQVSVLEQQILEQQSVKSASVTTATTTNDSGNKAVSTGTSTVAPSNIVVETAKALERAEKDYGFVRSPNEKANLYWHQKKATADTERKIKEGKRGILVLSGTGTGKTWMAGAVLRRRLDEQYHEGKTFSHIPYLYVTKSSVVTQTERVLERDFSVTVEDTSVINIEQLRSSAGQYWLKEEMYIEDGEEKFRWIWKLGVHPVLIIWDECQTLKNSTSEQHKIAVSYSKLKRPDTIQIFVSATPFTKVIEAKCFAISTRKSLEYICGKKSGFPEGTILTEETWPAYAAAIAYPSKPDEYNEAAVERLMLDLEDFVIRVKGVRPQFEAHNEVKMIDFQSKAEADYYHDAWTRYEREKAKLEAQSLAGSNINTGIMILVQFLKFRMAAEYCRREYLAAEMYRIVKEGKAAVCALNFKNTIVAVVQILHDKYGVSRSDISLIWGGGQTQLTDKQKAKKKIKGLTAEQLEATGSTQEELLENLDLDEVEDRELLEVDSKLKLGMQTQEERQREIDKFQSGKSLYCLYTLRAGGVGLSLHHSDEQVPAQFKCRRKESGYAVEEDIPRVPVRQREVLITPTWSPIEFVQGVGRVPRLTSLSPTKQTFVFYRGTIESRVADIASKGLRCLSKIVKQRESWNDMILNQPKEVTDKFISSLPEDSAEENEEAMLATESEE